MEYRVELLGISEFLPIKYSYTGPINWLYLTNTRSTVKIKISVVMTYRTDARYRIVAITQYNTV